MPTHLGTLPPPAHTGIRLARRLPAGTEGPSPLTPSLLSRPVVATERPTTQHGRHDPVHSSNRTSKAVYLALVRRPSLPLPSPSSPPPSPPTADRLDTVSLLLLLLLDILIPSLQSVILVAATSGRRGQSLRLCTVKASDSKSTFATSCFLIAGSPVALSPVFCFVSPPLTPPLPTVARMIHLRPAASVRLAASRVPYVP